MLGGLKKMTWSCSNEGQDIGVVKTMYNPLVSQEGGCQCYKHRGIQPLEYTMQNNLSFVKVVIVKYISRYKQNGGRGFS